MRCCVSYCRNTSDNDSGISFHGFPPEARLRSAWLKALGKLDNHLPDSPVVCSQHFLHDDISETENGSRQLRTGAIPSTVLVCMICFNTDGKMFLMSQYNLREAYEKLTGYPLCDGGNLKQTLCVECAQKLNNFSKLRDKSLRARSLMMKLVEKDDLITILHIKMINRAKHELKSDFVSTTLGPDHYDFILEHSDDKDRRADLEEAADEIAVKSECGNVLPEDEGMVVEDDNHTDNVIDELMSPKDISNDSIMLATKQLDEAILDVFSKRAASAGMADTDNVDVTKDLFSFESPLEHAYSEQDSGSDSDGECDTSQQYEPAAGTSDQDSPYFTETKPAVHPLNEPLPTLSTNSRVAPLPTILESPNETEIQAPEEDTIPGSIGAHQTTSINIESNEQSPQNDGKTDININRFTNCVVKLYDVLKYPTAQGTSLKKTKGVISVDNKNLDNFCNPFPSENESMEADINTVQSKIYCSNTSGNNSSLNHLCKYKTVQKSNSMRHMQKRFACKLCDYKCLKNSALMTHMRTHTGDKPYSCNLCEFETAHKKTLVHHLRTHTGEKPFACKLCDYKSSQNDALMTHMRAHTGEKPYSCNLCEYKTAHKNNLVRHLRTHTGEKPFACTLCDYKSSRNAALMTHIRTHTGDKPYSCNLCEYKSILKSSLDSHIKNHTGEKSFACKLCEFQAVKEHNLVTHMRTHTGEKPFSCNFCEFKCSLSQGLKTHLRIHTGEKPFACDLCGFKCTAKINLVRHKRTHTGEKPFSCKLCKYKCALGTSLKIHMRTHTGEKPYACKLCTYVGATPSRIRAHMKTHTGEKRFACELCDYKCVSKYALDRHLRTHTGEKPFACDLCEYKCTVKSSLVTHMRTHTGETPFTCKFCDLKFKQRGKLVAHTQTHTGEKPFVCELCGYKFNLKHKLDDHMRTHTGEKPFACEFCDYKSARQSNLVTHKRIHTGEKPYVCKLCHFKCSAPSNLVSHMRTHTGEQPYSCKLCEYKCTQKSLLIAHMRSHTGEPCKKKS